MKEGATTIWSLIMIIDYPHYFANWLWKDKLHIPAAPPQVLIRDT